MAEASQAELDQLQRNIDLAKAAGDQTKIDAANKALADAKART